MAITLKHPRPVTDEEILELSRCNPGYQFERSAKGELVVTPTGGTSSRCSAEVMGQLRDWNRTTKGGIVFDSSAGFRLPDGSLLSPDASGVRRDRWDTLTSNERQGFPPLCPDAVFEIVSPSDRLDDLHAKMQVYLANGARVAVLIDPQNRAAFTYRSRTIRGAPGHEMIETLFEKHTTVSLDPDLSKFVLDLNPLFSE